MPPAGRTSIRPRYTFSFAASRHLARFSSYATTTLRAAYAYQPADTAAVRAEAISPKIASPAADAVSLIDDAIFELPPCRHFADAD